MLSQVARFVDAFFARLAFMFIGTALMAAVAPLAPFFLVIPLHVDWTRPAEWALAGIVVGTVFGIIAAWTRVLTSAKVLARSPCFRVSVSLGLLAGVVATASVAATHIFGPQGSTYLLSVCLIATAGGTLLLLGTVSP